MRGKRLRAGNSSLLILESDPRGIMRPQRRSGKRVCTNLNVMANADPPACQNSNIDPVFTVLTGCSRKGAAMRVSSKGQVTIPQEIREKLGLLPDTEVEFVPKIQIVKSARHSRPTGGQMLVRRLRGRSNVRMSTDEILSLTRK